MNDSPLAVSVLTPLYNEEKSIQPLFQSVRSVLEEHGIEAWEFIFVDDGSVDSSWDIIRQMHAKYPEFVSGVRFRKNAGKAAALNAGFRKARGDVVITMDADLQDDPAEIPAFLLKLEEGYDVVSGWKRKREDPFIRVLASRIFNAVTNWVVGTRLHDLNCGYKAYRRESLQSLRLYGDLHRFIPVLLDNLGYKVGEIEVHHNPRQFGKSKYGLERYLRGFADLFTVLALTRYKFRPGHLFGGAGIVTGGSSFLVLLYLFALWLVGNRPIGTRPLFSVAVLGVIVSVQLISLGLMLELFVVHQADQSPEDLVQEEF